MVIKISLKWWYTEWVGEVNIDVIWYLMVSNHYRDVLPFRVRRFNREVVWYLKICGCYEQFKKRLISICLKYYKKPNEILDVILHGSL